MPVVRGFFQLRYFVLVFVAITFDALQFLIGVVIVAAFAVPGVAGAMLGCVISSNYLSGWLGLATACKAGSLIGGIIHLLGVAFTGGALQGVVFSIGAGLAAAVDLCFSVIGIAALSVLLLLSGMKVFSFKRGPFMLLKLIPGIDMLPLFTAMVIVSIFETERKTRLTGVAGAAATIAGASLGALGAAKSGLATVKGTRAPEEIRQMGQAGGEITHGAITSEKIQKRAPQLLTPQAALHRTRTHYQENRNTKTSEPSTARTNTAPSLREVNTRSMGLLSRGGYPSYQAAEAPA